MINPLKYTPKGDKKNTDYFNEYRMKIYKRRQESGLSDLLGNICAVVVQVQTGDGLAYLKELYAMTPYRYRASYLSKTHKIYCLVNRGDAPVYFVTEPLAHNYTDDFTRMNRMYPNSREKYNARYIGEIISTQDRNETHSILTSHDIQFYDQYTSGNELYWANGMLFTRPSDLTFNCVGYTEKTILDFDALQLGQSFHLTPEERFELEKIDEFTEKTHIKPLIKGIDHLATRILAGEREDAILEYLCLSNYYFWGAYNIDDMNSSTNVTRALHGSDILSPAKVFTANNTPYMVNSFEHKPMPTENFVRLYGRRLHHIAMEITDGDFSNGQKNINAVVDLLKKKSHIAFLAKVFGACKDVPDLEQIFSKHSELSLLITEYVQRCHGFDGFFTKQNVAALTKAAGLDETIKDHHEKRGLIGD